MQTILRPLAFLFFALCLTLSLCFSAQSKPQSAPLASPKLADLAWLAGHWSGEEKGVLTEEVWLEPAGGFLLGMNRSSSANGRGSFEFLRIEERPGGIVYLASPGGAAPTEFRLKSAAARKVEFENPEHDFPQLIRYELDEAGLLHASVSGEMNGKESSFGWVFKRTPD